MTGRKGFMRRASWLNIVTCALASPVICLAQATPGPTGAAPTEANPQTPQTPVPQKGAAGLTGDWFGLRPKLTDVGYTFAGRLTVDFSKPLRGANAGGSATRSLLDLNLTVDLKPVAGIEGGTVFTNFQQQHGQNAATEFGLYQEPTNVDADGRTQLASLWYEQTLWDGKLRFKAGKMDASLEFDSSDVAAPFLNGSFGAPPGNPLLPTYPDNATGLDAYVSPVKDMSIGAGVYDGSLAYGTHTGELGPFHSYGSPSAVYLIGEADVKWDFGAGRAGRAQIGGWYNTAGFAELTGGRQSGAGGEFLVVDQTLWRRDPSKDSDKRGIGAFVAYDGADARVFQVAHHFGGGATWTGPLEARPDDVLGTAVTYVRFAAGAGFGTNNELAWESFYKVQLTPSVAFTADVQWTPKAAVSHRDTILATARLELAL